MNEERHNRLISRARMRGRIFSTILGASALALVCGGWIGLTRKPPDTYCAVADNQPWQPFSTELNPSQAATRLNVSRKQIVNGMVGWITCEDSNGKNRVSTDEVVVIPDLPNTYQLLSRCLTIEHMPLSSEVTTGGSKVLCPANA